MNRVTFILENKFANELSDEKFAKLVEYYYELYKILLSDFVPLLMVANDIEVARAIVIKNMVEKIQKGEKSGVVECKVIEKGKIQCYVAEFIAMISPPSELATNLLMLKLKEVTNYLVGDN